MFVRPLVQNMFHNYSCIIHAVLFPQTNACLLLWSFNYTILTLNPVVASDHMCNTTLQHLLSAVFRSVGLHQQSYLLDMVKQSAPLQAILIVVVGWNMWFSAPSSLLVRAFPCAPRALTLRWASQRRQSIQINCHIIPKLRIDEHMCVWRNTGIRKQCIPYW